MQYKVNNLNSLTRKTSFACFEVKQRNIFWLALRDKENIVHSAIVSGEFWESIGGKISSLMDHRVGTSDRQSEGLQVFGVGKPWTVYLEGMEEWYILESLSDTRIKS